MRTLPVAAVLGAVSTACAPQFVDAAGVAVESDAGDAGMEAGTIEPLPPSLLHRYRFDGTGTLVVDSKGAAHGTVVGTELDGSGSLTLAGGMTGEYVDLPDGLISGLSDASFEVWVEWNGGIYWQRIFDFGNSVAGSGTSYLFLTPKGTNETGFLRLVHSTGQVPGETVLDGPVALPETPAVSHVVAVIDDQNDSMSLYLDGVLQGSATLTNRLADINDVNNWLGQSNYPADNGFSGTYYEFRIYDSALSEAQVQQSLAAGPDAKLPGEP